MAVQFLAVAFCRLLSSVPAQASPSPLCTCPFPLPLTPCRARTQHLLWPPPAVAGAVRQARPVGAGGAEHRALPLTGGAAHKKRDTKPGPHGAPPGPEPAARLAGCECRPWGRGRDWTVPGGGLAGWLEGGEANRHCSPASIAHVCHAFPFAYAPASFKISLSLPAFHFPSCRSSL